MAALRNASLLFIAVLFCGACASTPPAKDARKVVAFIHASVIPMDSERVLADQTVVVADRTIVAVGPSSSTKIPAGALRVDATNRYLIPALCDMHVHQVTKAWDMMLMPEARVANDQLPYDRFLFPYIASGVTTVQELSATQEELVLRDRIARGELLGPRMILGKMIDGPKKAWPPPLSTWVANPDEAREAVRRTKAEGYDKIKVYSFLSRESYDAIVETAKELKIDVIGHVPMAVGIDHVLDSGQKMIAHSEELAKHAGSDPGAAAIDALATRMSDSGVWLIPTLITTESILEVFDNREGLVHRAEAAYYQHPLQAGVWTFVLNNLYGPIPPPAQKELRDAYVKFQRPLTRSFRDKGGKILAGSDSILPGLVPGFALHRELGELVAAGLTPYEALRSATAAPFEYLGEADRAGTIAVGRQSDLLLLDASPLQDISNTSKIAGVLVRGRWIDSAEIERTMKDIAANPVPVARR